MSQQQFDVRRVEEVAPGDFEVGKSGLRHGLADTVGIRIGTDDDGGAFVVVLFVQSARLLRDFLPFSFNRSAVYDSQVAGCSRDVIVRYRQQLTVDFQLLLSIVVEDIQQILRRTVVALQMMDVAFAAHLQERQRLHFRSHEREDGLLLVAQVHHCRLVVRRQQVDDGKLHGVEVLHLVHLYPRITSACRVGTVDVVGAEQQVLEVQQMVVRFVAGVTAGVIHLPEQHTDSVSQFSVKSGHIGFVHVFLCMMIDVHHRLFVVFLLL